MDDVRPGKGNLHISFWLTHIAMIVGGWMFVSMDGGQTIGGIIFLLSLVFLIWYCVAIAGYANRLNRRGIFWGGLSFLFAPFAMWISYIMSFFIGPLEPKNTKGAV